MKLPSAKRGRSESASTKPNVPRTLCAGIAVLVLSACNVTFQSSQYNFVKGLVVPQALTHQKNWHVRWQGQGYDVYAINHEKGTFFANENGLLVVFDGWQVTGLSLPESRGQKVATVEATTSVDGSVTLQYFKGEREELAEDLCRTWRRDVQRSGLLGWRQLCEGPMGTYKNEIDLNELGQLVSLSFVLLPSVQPIEIDLR